MKSLGITAFKARALRILSQVAKDKEKVIVTKRGKPVVEVISYSTDKPAAVKLAEALMFEKEIVSPLNEDAWDTCK